MATNNNKSTMISIPRIQVFRPTFEEMKDFEGYITKIEKSGAHKAGLVKIIPPPEWKPRRKDPTYQSEEIDSLVIKAPIQQVVQGRLGLYQQYNIQKKSLTVKEFKKLADSSKHRTPDFFDYEELERKYWKNIAYNPPIYGADVPGSLYDDDVDEFNINRLNTILDMVNESYGIKIMGVNTAYLYFGMWKTTFAWHTEDMDLHSINYLHYGAPKSWYCVPPEHGRRLERLAAGFFPTSVTSCPAFLRHKMTLISPAVLKQYSIPYNKITQEAGEFMVTFPYSYHAGYNHGYNCAESTNFATKRWVEYGKRATRCNCRSDSVKISMEAFIKKYQPDRYDLWLQGKDIGPHPEDPTHISPAPLPSDYELEVLSKVSKSKRHPPYKLEPETSETGSMDNNNTNNHNNVINNNHCEQVAPVMSAFPTKAALKHFETPGPSSSDLLQLMQKHGYGEDAMANLNKDQNYLNASPPDIKEAVKRMRNRFAPPKSAPNKRSRKSSTPSSTVSIAPSTPTLNGMMMTNNYKNQYPRTPQSPNTTIDQTSNKTMCSQPSHSALPLTWMSRGGHDPGALQLIDRFLNCDLQPPTMFPSSSSLTTSATNYYQPSSDHQNHSKSGLTNYYHHPSDQPHPPTGQSTYSYPQPEPHHHTIGEPSDNYHTSDYDDEKPTDLSTYFHQSEELISTVTEISSPGNFPHQSHTSPNSSTSNKDLIVRTKTVQSDDLSKLLADQTSRCDFREILKRVPVQPYLYQHLPYNFFGEQMYNCCMSSVFPYCSVCIMMRKLEISDDWVEVQAQLPSSSPILIPRASFVSKLDEEGEIIYVEEVKISPLLVCSDCKVCVHSTCYGVTHTLEIDSDNWLCDRCKIQNYGAHCCLCPLRGGALKQTTEDSKWVHLTCAVLQPGVIFADPISKKGIDVKQIKTEWRNNRTKCIYCQKLHAKLSDYIDGFCIQCYMAPRCSSKFHTTCAYLNGAKFEMDDWSDPIRVYCTRCIEKASGKNAAIIAEDEVDLETIVLAKHKNRRYYEAIIIDKNSMILHHAHLDDNSILQTLRNSDILEPDIEKDGIPEVGDDIKITYEKEIQYGKYAGNHTLVQYTVKFDDGWQNKLITRDKFYRLDEKIPDKVQAKRSQATDVSVESLFWANNLKKKVKPSQANNGL